MSCSNFKLNDDPGIKLSGVGQCMLEFFDWAHRGLNWVVFSSGLAVCEFRAISFVSSQYVYTFDCVLVVIHKIN